MFSDILTTTLSLLLWTGDRVKDIFYTVSYFETLVEVSVIWNRLLSWKVEDGNVSTCKIKPTMR